MIKVECATVVDTVDAMAQTYAMNLVGKCECKECWRTEARREFAIAFMMGARACAIAAGISVTTEVVSLEVQQQLLEQWVATFGPNGELMPC